MKKEIISKIEELLKVESVLENREEFEKLFDEFKSLQNKEEVITDSEEKDSDEKTTEPSEEDVKFNELLNNYHVRRKEENQIIATAYEEAYAKKIDIIKRLTALVESEENIGKAFNTFNEIREEWQNTGKVHPSKYQNLQSEYSKVVEKFYYNINIYKQLKEHDLKRNYELKISVIDRLKKVLELESGKEIENQVKQLQSEWDEIGPTYKEKWEEIRNEFWANLKSAYTKIQDYYKNKKEEIKKNLEFKKAIIEKIIELIADKPEDHNAWEKKTNLLLAIQDEWKKIGFVGREENEKLWSQFRALYDQFFMEKKSFYEGLRSGHKDNKTKKEELIAQVEELKQSKDWKNTTNKLVRLQKEWKKIGSAGKRHEQKLWNKFRSACDEFFNAKKSHFNEQDKAQIENLSAKKKLIEDLNALTLGEDLEANKELLLKLNKQYNSLGLVPIKDKERINKSFNDAFEAKFKTLGVSEEDKEILLFQSRLDALKSATNISSAFSKERAAIKRHIDKLKEEVIQYENNLGFFSNAKNASGLLGGVQDKIDNAKTKIDQLKTRIKLLNVTERELLASQSVEGEELDSEGNS